MNLPLSDRPGVDGRREPRFEVQSLVPALLPGQTTPIFCAVSDISQSGLFLELEEPPAVDTQLKLGPASSSVSGRVVFVMTRAMADQVKRRAGVGVQLTQPIDPDAFLLGCREAEAADRARRELDALLADAEDEPIPLPSSSEAIALPGATETDAAIALPRAAIELPAATQPIPLPADTIALPATTSAIPLPGPTVAAADHFVVESSPVLLAPPSTASTASTAPTASPTSAPASSGVRPAGATVLSGTAAVRRARKLLADEASEPRERAAPQQETVAESVVQLAEVVLVDGVASQGLLTQALTLDDFAPLVSRHSLEALALVLRKRPALIIVGANAPRLSGRLLVAELKRRPELAGVGIVLIDGGDEADIEGVSVWRAAPSSLQRARLLIDEAMASVHPRAPGGSDAKEIAVAMLDFGQRLQHDREVDAAVSVLRYAAELAPTVAAHTLALARVLLGGDAHHCAEASALIERVARQDPRNAEAFYLRGVALDQRGNVDEAKTALQRALLLAPNNEEIAVGLERLAAGQSVLRLDDEPKKRAGFFGWLRGLLGR